MTAMDVFERYAAAEAELMEIQEKIDRRHALATGTTARPLSHDGGSRGSGDASVRLLDYMGNIEDLEKQKADRERMRDNDRACCMYLAEMLPPMMASIMTRRFLEGKSQRTCAEETGYSVTSIRRLQRHAEGILREIVLIQWDGNHIPIVAIPDGSANILRIPKKMDTDGS